MPRRTYDSRAREPARWRARYRVREDL